MPHILEIGAGAHQPTPSRKIWGAINSRDFIKTREFDDCLAATRIVEGRNWVDRNSTDLPFGETREGFLDIVNRANRTHDDFAPKRLGSLQFLSDPFFKECTIC